MPTNSTAHAHDVPLAEINLKLRNTYIAETRQCLLGCAAALEELRRTVTILGAPVQTFAVSVNREHEESANLREILRTEHLSLTHALQRRKAYLEFYYGGEFGRLIGAVSPGKKNNKPYGPFSRQIIEAQHAVHKALSEARFIGTFVVVDGAILAEIPCENFERVILLPIRTGRPCYTDPRRPVVPHVAEWLRGRATELAEGQRIVVGGHHSMFETWSGLERLDFENRRADLPDDVKSAFDHCVSMSDPVEPISGDQLDLLRADGLAVLAVNDGGHDNALPAAVLDLETPIPAPSQAPSLTTRVLCRPRVAPVFEAKFLDLANSLIPHAEALLTRCGAVPGDYSQLLIDRELGSSTMNLFREGLAGKQWLGPGRRPSSVTAERAPGAWKDELVKMAGVVVNSAAEFIQAAGLDRSLAWAEISCEFYHLRVPYIFVAQGPFPSVEMDDFPFEIGRLSPSGRALSDGEAVCIVADPDVVSGFTAPEREVYDRIRAPLDAETVRALDDLILDDWHDCIWLWRRDRLAALLSHYENSIELRTLLGLIDLEA